MATTLPERDGGYAVDTASRTVHERHAEHAAGLRRSTRKGTLALLNGREPVLCEDCFPAPAPARPRRTRIRANVAEEQVAAAAAEIAATTTEPPDEPVEFPPIEDAQQAGQEEVVAELEL